MEREPGHRGIPVVRVRICHRGDDEVPDLWEVRDGDAEPEVGGQRRRLLARDLRQYVVQSLVHAAVVVQGD